MCFLVSLLADCALVLYGGYAFGTLLRGAERMAEGDMEAKVPLERLYGAYKRGGEHLNALSEAAVEAARNQMKSERMKAELITNVSHDIKTPLTSVINYIDLLQKAETEQQRQEYLQVLERQSQRLKKLIEDLMDMSKASTGNVTVNITTVDAVEAVNQALGEFSDKLDAAELLPVFHYPEEAVNIKADGRLTWRVISNLLSNAVKYAMPGTRLYIDLSRFDNTVLLSLKNVSKQELNTSAEDLMERFVQGDTSRSTDGSGLGLNIAKTLMELQNGKLQLTVDGDLFKVTLVFPAAE
jgi:signal transduction histidine kinase